MPLLGVPDGRGEPTTHPHHQQSQEATHWHHNIHFATQTKLAQVAQISRLSQFVPRGPTRSTDPPEPATPASCPLAHPATGLGWHCALWARLGRRYDPVWAGTAVGIATVPRVPMGRQSDALHSAPQPSNSTALATAPVVAPASYIGTILSHLDAVHDVEAMPWTAARATLCRGSARGSAGVTLTSRMRVAATPRPTNPSGHPARATPGRYPAVSVEDDGLGADLGAQRATERQWWTTAEHCAAQPPPPAPRARAINAVWKQA